MSGAWTPENGHEPGSQYSHEPDPKMAMSLAPKMTRSLSPKMAMSLAQEITRILPLKTVSRLNRKVIPQRRGNAVGWLFICAESPLELQGDRLFI